MMLPLLLIALGAGALVLYMTSSTSARSTDPMDQERRTDLPVRVTLPTDARPSPGVRDWFPPVDPPRAQPPAQPSKSPRERPSREILNKETNERFWNRTHYKPGQRLDMSNAEDQKMFKIWMNIFHEVQREANEGKLSITSPRGLDHERSIAALQADLAAANQERIAAMEVMRRAAEIMQSMPEAGRTMMASAQATYAAAQEKARAAEAGLKKLGVNPLMMIPPPTRRPR